MEHSTFTFKSVVNEDAQSTRRKPERDAHTVLRRHPLPSFQVPASQASCTMPNQAPLTTPLTGSNIVSPETATDARHPSTAQEAAETSNASSDAAPDLEKNVGPPSHQSSTRKAADPNIVDFDGPDDPMKAVNWPRRKKWNMVALLSAMTFIT